MEQYLNRLRDIFRAIDSFYDMAMKHYDFSCAGCDDNCCVTKFHHHTIVEEYYLREGIESMDESRKGALRTRAAAVAAEHLASPEDARVMCPLNENGLCVLYEHRPMICGIHGVPFELHKPDMSIEYGTGCHRFQAEKMPLNTTYFIFNRTIFYRELAKLEEEVRKSLSFAGPYRKTTAEMVLAILGEDPGAVQCPPSS
ncbi:MAG: hypothetical protein MZV70_28300 [Desulfobacterales bacterium]|nr:hypothetical protein [Desulfobacterales bacterium]